MILPTLALTTGRWVDAWRAKQRGTLDVVPVRASLGLPKFWPAAKTLPVAEQLAPVGLFNVRDRDEFERRYRQRLDRIGVDIVLHRLDVVWTRADRRTLCLLCFEDVHEPGGWCHRRIAAEWIEERSGLAVPELDLAQLPEPDRSTQ